VKRRILSRTRCWSRFFKSLLKNEVALNFLPHWSCTPDPLKDRKKVYSYARQRLKLAFVRKPGHHR
jgi:hypothetical protein